MVKIALSHRFFIIPSELLKDYLQTGGSPYIPEGSQEVIGLGGPVVFSQDPINDEHGTSWNQQFAATAGDSSLVTWDGQRAYIAFHMTDGSIRLIGNAYACPLIRVTPYAGVVRISAEFQAFQGLQL